MRVLSSWQCLATAAVLIGVLPTGLPAGIAASCFLSTCSPPRWGLVNPCLPASSFLTPAGASPFLVQAPAGVVASFLRRAFHRLVCLLVGDASTADFDRSPKPLLQVAGFR